MIKFYTKIIQVHINKIQSADENSNIMSDIEYKRMKEDIVRNGFLEPIQVRKNGKGYVVVNGHHRVRALEELGEKKVPCIVLSDDNITSKVRAIHLNTARGRQNPKILAKIIKQLKDSGMSIKDIEDKLVYDEDILNDTLDLLNLPDDIDGILREEDEKLSEDLPEIWTFVVPAEYSGAVENMFSDESHRGKVLGILCQKQK